MLGCGALACWAHLPILARLPGARLVAAADPDPAARARAERIARIPVHERAEDAIARADVDAVVITSATPSHAPLALAAARAGKDRKSTRLNSSHMPVSRMPSSA